MHAAFVSDYRSKYGASGNMAWLWHTGLLTYLPNSLHISTSPFSNKATFIHREVAILHFKI